MVCVQFTNSSFVFSTRKPNTNSFDLLQTYVCVCADNLRSPDELRSNYYLDSTSKPVLGNKKKQRADFEIRSLFGHGLLTCNNVHEILKALPILVTS